MPKIEFGKIEEVGGKKLALGANSQYDIKGLINAHLSPINATINKIEDKLEIDNKKLLKFNELKHLTLELRDIVDGLRFIPGASNMDKNVFDTRVVTLIASNGVPANTYATIAASGGAELGSFNFNISQLATPLIQQSSLFSSRSTPVVNALGASNPNMFNSGTFQINNANITITNTDSLNNIAYKINLANQQTQVTASVIAPSANNYQLLLVSQIPGVAFNITDTSDVLNNLMASSSTVNQEPFTLQAAQGANFTYNNVVPVTRSSNIINDFIDGITITLSQPTPPGVTLTASIQPDYTAVAKKMLNFVDKLNDISNFRFEQQKRGEDGRYAEGAILQGDSSLEIITSGINTILNQQILGINSFTTIYDIGFTLQKLPDNLADKSQDVNYSQLSIDQDIMSSAIEQQFESFQQLFEFNFFTSSPNLLSTTYRGNGLTVSQLNFDIDITRPNNQIVFVNYTDNSNNAQSINATFTPKNGADLTQGGVIVGQNTTILNGFQFLYIGGGQEVITANVIQGVGDRLYNFLESIKDGNVIKNSIDAVYKAIGGNKKEIHTLENKLINERDKWVQRYSKMESDIGKSKMIVQQLTAEQDALNRRNGG